MAHSRPTKIILSVIAPILLALSGCGGEDKPNPSAAADQSPGVGHSAIYENVEDLVADVQDAGGISCKRWRTPLRMRLATDSRYCDKPLYGPLEEVALYDDDVKKDKAMRESRGMAKVDWDCFGDRTSQSILVGPNWTVIGDLDLMERVQEDLGGFVQDNTDVYENPSGRC